MKGNLYSRKAEIEAKRKQEEIERKKQEAADRKAAEDLQVISYYFIWNIFFIESLLSIGNAGKRSCRG